MSARPFEVVTFDCYGTLIDWEEGIARAFATAAAAKRLEIDRRAILRAYAEIEPRVEAERYRTYREVLDETAARVAARLRFPLPASQVGFLSDSLASWPPFPDTVPALERLVRAGYVLGILSNVDDDLLAATRRRLGVDFAIVVTAEQVRSYKPGQAHFVEARQRIGARPWLHAAQSWYHDVVPASALGIPVAWVNRRSETPRDDARPLQTLQDLTALADWLWDEA